MQCHRVVDGACSVVVVVVRALLLSSSLPRDEAPRDAKSVGDIFHGVHGALNRHLLSS
jgi:hypothetical protein